MRNRFNIPVYIHTSINNNNYIWYWYGYKSRWINENRFGIQLNKNGKKQI